MSAQNVETVRAIYAAFQRGEVPFILDRLADNVEWGYNVARSSVPWHTTVRGKRAIPRYFGALVENLRMQRLEPLSFVHSDNHVVVLVHLEYVVRKSGRPLSFDQVQWWTFDQSGKVQRLWHYEDTKMMNSECGIRNEEVNSE